MQIQRFISAVTPETENDRISRAGKARSGEEKAKKVLAQQLEASKTDASKETQFSTYNRGHFRQ